ncbi:MAG: SCP2 sterol-binding domain-containing protein [Acidimicrobiales bacterium]|jgi:putative sterol carrier protein|nr:SCP2 sterol-binding domain-containing protein [Acidimicrobiales bacterium]MDP6297841.1 SCP2 sterol-binding domain-containing protein [Acidimicrobiales bacterium]HJM29417.1 SCP2 sterol-binding domain-containing protein [Acidimicrobiales bacterium]HJM96891.1 SCP2 sterol-binding domain-containing protein [Acidimicrobiales bacterium]
MSEFLSEEWLRELEDSGSELPKGEISIISQYEISGTGQGKIHFYTVIENGQFTEVAVGKHKDADCGISTNAAEAFKILSGEKKVMEAFMQGDLKVKGDYKRYLLEFDSIRKSGPWKEMCKSMVLGTDQH